VNFDVPKEESTDIFTENNSNCDSLKKKVTELESKITELSQKNPNDPKEVEALGSKMVLSGNIVDNVTDSPVKNAKVMLVDPKTNEIVQEATVTDASSRFSFDVTSGKQYRIIAEAPGHFKYIEDFAIPTTDKTDAHLKVIPLQKSNSLKSIVLGWQFFDSNSAKLIESKIIELDNLARVLVANPEIRLKIIGHTDSDGTDVFNKDLSQRRANTVASYLVSKGVDGSRLFKEAKGETEPLYDNTTKYKKWNRRVEIYIVQ
jgi:outer membrane protein OmpA-like peptidoglycan-associated protein